MPFEPLTTRLFPKGQGVTGYRLTGIAARCGRVLLSDFSTPAVHLLDRRAQGGDARVVFLSMRNGFAALRHFADAVLPAIDAPFVLASGSEDMTLPNQIDRRWRPYAEAERAAIARIAASPLLRRWFVENLDSTEYPVMEPLPLGLTFPAGLPPGGLVLPQVPPLAARPLRILVAHRRREGPQWQPRAETMALAGTAWAGFSTVIETELPEADYLRRIEDHAFVLCVEGGGLDPAPKAWHALLHGAIPVIRDSATAGAYAGLPVARVAQWQTDALSPGRLRHWRDSLCARFDDPVLRADVLARLGLDFWWRQILAAHGGRTAPAQDGTASGT